MLFDASARGGCGCRNYRRRRAVRPRCRALRRAMPAFRWTPVRCPRRWARHGARRAASPVTRSGSRRVCLRRPECAPAFPATSRRFPRRAVSSRVGWRSIPRRRRPIPSALEREIFGVSRRGVPRRRFICSFRRLRTSLQSPRFSVTLQINFTTPSLSAAISLAAASRNVSAAAREFFGQHQQKLAAAAGAEQNFREPQFGEQSPGQDLAQQADPMGAAGEGVIALPAGRRQQEVFDPKKLPLKKNLHRMVPKSETLTVSCPANGLIGSKGLLVPVP